jgi:hypothetical protein
MKGEVVTLVTHVGEVIGRVASFEGDRIVLDHPRLFVNQEGGSGLAPGICMTGVQDPKEGVFFKGSVVAVVATADELVKAWQQQTSGIIL